VNVIHGQHPECIELEALANVAESWPRCIARAAANFLHFLLKEPSKLINVNRRTGWRMTTI
jgi:hypothetical protein